MYDRGGNIISKSRYAYTTGVLGTALETIVYGYGDYNWMDKMTHYNYLGVSYDDIGNPTSFNGWNCTWEKGRQLKQMTDNSVNTIYYKYNADGLRVQKRKVTIYGSDVTTNYILHGKNIVHMTQGTDTLHFWYDAQGRPAIVEYNGTKYAYIHNLQGDIVGIIDSTGAEVVQYTYDAWGKVLSTAGTMASSLGTVQPFRYRGYVYDVETGLYYLRSRYYNPEWGRFINADTLIKGNMFAYCENNPIISFDPLGENTQIFVDLGYPITETVLEKGDKFGSHNETEMIDRQFVVSALLQMSKDPKSGNKAWKYGHTMLYGMADCNGIFRSIVKAFYTQTAYHKILGTETTVSGIIPRIQVSPPIPITDKDAIPACSIVISKDYNHMGMTIGTYQNSKNAIVESAIRFGGVHVSTNWKVGSGSREFYYYCQVNIIDYNTPIKHTGPRYLTFEDD